METTNKLNKKSEASWENVKAFLAEMAKQDNRMTALPIYYTIKDWCRIDGTWQWQERGMFLTESDAKEHFESNNYHYHSKAHIFISHSWRAPKLQGFLDDLCKIFLGQETLQQAHDAVRNNPKGDFKNE